MPIPQTGYRRSNLTKEQRADATAAIYGVDRTTMPDQQFSAAEIERMRAILADVDGGRTRVGIQEFDLSKPPVEPYVYREFPRLMYFHIDGTVESALSAAHQSALEAEGYSIDPPPPVEHHKKRQHVANEEDEATEIALLDAKARKARK